MTEFDCLTLFVLSFVLFPCEGQITSPPDGTNFTFLPGSTAKIQWTFGNDIKTVLSRIWSFTSSDGSQSVIARIIDDDPPREIPNNTLPGVTIEKPATLVLNNVDKRYNGKYRFQLSATGVGGGDFHVVVFIAEKPTVTLSCSSPTTVNEGDDFTCVGRGEGGNPPADVAWYKDGVQIGEIGKEEQTLTLSDVSKTNRGTYECEARSHTDDRFADKKSIELKVNFKPDKPNIKFDPKEPATVGESVTVTCESDGFPTPSYTIFHNDTVVSTDKPRVISKVKWNHAGNYTCNVKNILGSNSTSVILTVKEQGPPTSPPTPPTSPTGKKPNVKPDDEGESGGLNGGAIAGIIIGVLLLLVIIVVVVYFFCCKSKEKEGYRGNRNVDPVEMDDNAYDTVKNEPSGSKSNPQASKPQASTLPVYAAVDKNNREGKPLYATLDTVAMNSDGSKRRSEESKPEPTQYASIDFERSGEVPRADLV